jgi:hypothetical protein
MMSQAPGKELLLTSVAEPPGRLKWGVRARALFARLGGGQLDPALLAFILAGAAWLRFLETDRPFIGRHDYHAAF